MHTGEYAYQCGVCPARRARRNQFRIHWSKECVSESDPGIINLYNIDNRATRTVAYLGANCNYVQLNAEHTFNHIRTQHNLKQVKETHCRILIPLEVHEHFIELVDDNLDGNSMILVPSCPSLAQNLPGN